MPRPELDDDDLREIWCGWWDNWSMAEILRNRVTRKDIRISDIKRVLSEPVPQALEADDRSLGYMHAFLPLESGGDLPAGVNDMVFFQHPTRMRLESWKTGIRTITRIMKTRGAVASVDAEEVETDCCRGKLADGYLGFTVDAMGAVTEGIRFPERTVQQPAPAPGP